MARRLPGWEAAWGRGVQERGQDVVAVRHVAFDVVWPREQAEGAYPLSCDGNKGAPPG